MAKKRSSGEKPTADPELRVAPDDAHSKLDERIALADELLRSEPKYSDELEAAIAEFSRWDAYNEELLSRLFTTKKYADEYSWWGVASTSMYEQSPQQKLNGLRENLRDKIRRLQSIRERLELIPLSPAVVDTTKSPKSHTNRVFVVHGHDEAARETVARFLEKLDVHAIILHEKPTEGRTLVEKLEHYGEVDFAVVLLTPDDLGATQSEGADGLKPRPRQNVVLELGYFVGQLGRQNVCALYKGPLDLPSDYIGVGYVELDIAGGWRVQLARELRSAGFNIDMNRVL